ncbi:MAG: hypothetical protein EHM36_01000 [Deltaproteobacteria bacterium]|nr:MAG: hypothetical protein EHM36_01000 [Deltaproteobacteria bacterium]
MKPLLLGNLIGILLALLYFSASAFYSNRFVSSSRITAIPLTLVGFGLRLIILALIFYGLSGINGIHFKAALITFVLAYSVCAFWKASRLFREAGPSTQNPRKSPGTLLTDEE